MKTFLGYLAVALIGLIFVSSVPVSHTKASDSRESLKIFGHEDSEPLLKSAPAMYNLPSVSVEEGQSSVMEEVEALDEKCHKIDALLRRHGK